MARCTLVTLIAVFCGALAVPSRRLLSRKTGSTSLGSSKLGMYDGNETSIEKHPYLVDITYDDAIWCTGTIISDSWVLLSGDCTFSGSNNDLAVIAGSQDGYHQGKKYKVQEVVTHPNYTIYTFDYDYGLVKIKGKFQWSNKIHKIGLPKRSLKPGTQTTISGWGVPWDSRDNMVLRQGHMTVISQTECKSIYSAYSIYWTPRMGCVYNKGKTTPCDYDFNDPITIGKVMYNFVIAIASDGACTSDALPAITMDVYDALPWIKSVTGIE